MHTGHIEGATHRLGAPKNWVRGAVPCGTLDVRHDHTAAGPGMTSAWFPTPEEIARIVSGAPIYLTVIGTVHPPVAMAVGPTPD